MNSRIYLQPDAVPTQDEIRTANRLFRHFGKEVTFLQQDAPSDADITMNRLRWTFVKSNDIDAALIKSGNLVLDLAYNTETDFQALFDNNDEIANLVIIKKSEEILELEKDDQTKAKRK